MMISKWWQGEGLKGWLVEGEEVVRCHLRTLSVAKKGIESDEEGSGVDTEACLLLLIFFSVADKVAIHSLEAVGLSVDRDWMIFHASTGSIFDSARWL